MLIQREITIEELVDRFPGTIQFLSDHGIRCIRCGEPIWGTLEEAALEKGFSTEKIDEMLFLLNDFISNVDRRD
ncbi:MAG: DUF1858 domain-containing protein [Bacteroidales bacterium]|nr:DUF1858 domain-containing protein [Bacteroidales bacterium]